MTEQQHPLLLGDYDPGEPVPRPRGGSPDPVDWDCINAGGYNCPPELPQGEFCPEHPRESRVLMATPVSCWNTNPNSVYARVLTPGATS